MSIDYKSNVDIEAMKKKLLEERKRLLGIALEDAISEIKARSTAGKDVQGSTFKALTPSYRKFKTQKTGRGSADMLLSGKMLAAIRSKIEAAGTSLIGRIFFSSTAEAEKARGNMKIRKFFGLSKEQVAKIVNKLKGN